MCYVACYPCHTRPQLPLSHMSPFYHCHTRHPSVPCCHCLARPLLSLSYTSPFCPSAAIVSHVTARSCYATTSQSFILAEHLLDSSARICGCYLPPVMMPDNLSRNLLMANSRVFCTGQALLLCFLPERYLNYDKSCVFRYRSVVL